jgi:glycosyltransferase involved in cell wall biosynthesis
VGQPSAVFVSFRFGGHDGVAVEARKWEWALRELGFLTRRVAGEFEDALRPDDTWLGFLAIQPVDGADPRPAELGAALGGADLVVIENLCSLPLNPTAAAIAAAVVMEHEGRVVFHHHDLPWERPALPPTPGIPPRRENSLHVTVSEHARRSLEARGIPAVAISNAFAFDEFDGDRAATRAAFDFADDEIVLLQPTRAIPRKGIDRAVHFAGALADALPRRRVRYWLTGPAEDGYDEELAAVLRAARVPVTRGRAARVTDAYAAADVVVFPSTWEGFGNPVVEAMAARRPLVVAHYPALDELVVGLSTFAVEDPEALARWLEQPDPALLDANLDVARRRFALETLPSRLSDALTAVGWVDW